MYLQVVVTHRGEKLGDIIPYNPESYLHNYDKECWTRFRSDSLNVKAEAPIVNPRRPPTSPIRLSKS